MTHMALGCGFAPEVAVRSGRQVGDVIDSSLSPLPCIPETFVIVSPFASGMMRSTAQTRLAIVRRCGIACFVAQSAGICLPGMCSMRMMFAATTSCIKHARTRQHLALREGCCSLQITSAALLSVYTVMQGCV